VMKRRYDRHAAGAKRPFLLYLSALSGWQV
jgi:hypothetical protein